MCRLCQPVHSLSISISLLPALGGGGGGTRAGIACEFSHVATVPCRVVNDDEDEADKLIPVSKDDALRRLVGSARLRSAVVSIMKKRLIWSGVTGSLDQIRNMLFSEKYQLKHCLASRGGGRSKVRAETMN